MKKTVHRYGRCLLPAILVFLGSIQPAEAQLSRSGSIVPLLARQTVGAPAIKGTDSGYDARNQVFLVVGSCYGVSCPAVFGSVYGIFVNGAGAPASAPFSIDPGGSEGHFPRVRYSPQANGGQGAFLVTWLQEGAGGLNSVRARLVAFPGVPLGSVATLNDGSSHAWIESAAAVGYSPASQRFLVAWRTYPHVTSPAHVASRLVDINGNPVEGVVKLSAGFARDPGIAWNSTSDSFGVSFSAENSAGSAGFSGFAVVPPVNAASFARNSFNQISGFTFISDVDYNPDTGRFVMVWHQNEPGVPYEVRAAEIDAAGQVVSTGMVSRELPGYDAHSIAFNPSSRTFAVSSIAGNDEIVAAELNRNGVRTSAVTLVGPGVVGRYPRISAHLAAPQWNITLSNNFQSVTNLVVGTTSSNGGPSGTNPPPPDGGGGTQPPPPPPPPAGCTTVQPGPGWTCVNGGWLPPSTPAPAPAPPPPPPPAPAPGCTTVQPGPDWTCSNGNWLPPGAGAPAPPPPAPPAPAPAPGCTTVQPGAGWTCVNGGWLPPGAGCSTVQPGAGWTCVGGNWLPPSGGGGGTAPAPQPTTCTTPQPGPDWGCLNGNWLPPGMGGTAPAPGPAPAPPPPTSGCTSPQPGADWICVDGGWRPVDMVCPTVRPGPNWVCVNGDWRPAGLDAEPEPEPQTLASLLERTAPRRAIVPDRAQATFSRRT
jgi:hypothetical protein